MGRGKSTYPLPIQFIYEMSQEVLDGFWVRVFFDVVPPYCSFCAHICHRLGDCKRRPEKENVVDKMFDNLTQSGIFVVGKVFDGLSQPSNFRNIRVAFRTPFLEE
ncbi:hypothetical protein Leryth_024813, partial [Lithospermum erythrorhizon]